MPAPTPIVQAVQVSIGGMPVVGDRYGNHDWPVTLGINGPHVVWKLAPDVVEVLLKLQETEIKITTPSGKVTIFKRIRVLREVPTEDARIRAVALSDVRSYLSTGWVRKAYNLRVPSATTKLVSLNAALPAASPSSLQPPLTLQNYLFAPFSLRGSDDGTAGVPWNADQIADDVLFAACTGHDFPPILFQRKGRKRSSFIPNDVYVDATGDKALGQVLGALGGLDIRVSPLGVIELVDAFMGAETRTLDPVVAAYSLEWKGRLRFVSMSNVCPKAGRVLVTRRVEIRGDAADALAPVSQSAGNAPVLTNVIQVTDPTLPYPSAQTPSVRGTFIPATSFFTAVASLADQTAPAPALRYQFLTIGMGGTPSPSFVMSTKLEDMYVTPAALSFLGPSIVWAARCRSIRAHWRRTFRLNPTFAKQCLPGSIKAERAALVDPATGTYQPATIYTDFCQQPTNRGLFSSPTFSWNMNMIPGSTAGTIKTYNNDSFPDDPFPLATVQPAPFGLTVLDPTNGIMTLDDLPDPAGKRQNTLIPSLLVDAPVVDSSRILKGNTIGYMEQSQLVTTQRVAIVFSAVPAGPNNVNQLHEYPVDLADALKRLGVDDNAVEAKGPAVDLRIRDNVAQARIPWEDENRDALLGCFSNSGVQDPSDLVPVNDAELQDYATSLFSCLVAMLLDRYEGAAQIEFRPDLAPVGSLTNVTHTVMADGSLYTTLFAQPAPPALDPESLMKQGSRNVLFRSLGA